MEITGAFIPDFVEMNGIEMNEWPGSYSRQEERMGSIPQGVFTSFVKAFWGIIEKREIIQTF